MALFQDLNNKGKTIVFVTHEPDIARCATRNIIFKDGHILRESIVTDRIIAHEMLASLPVEDDQFNEIQ
jgi:putative ABC transport system ATP-binding protein